MSVDEAPRVATSGPPAAEAAAAAASGVAAAAATRMNDVTNVSRALRAILRFGPSSAGDGVDSPPSRRVAQGGARPGNDPVNLARPGLCSVEPRGIMGRRRG